MASVYDFQGIADIKSFSKCWLNLTQNVLFVVLGCCNAMDELHLAKKHRNTHLVPLTASMTARMMLLTDRQQSLIACITYGSAKLSCGLLPVLASHVVTHQIFWQVPQSVCQSGTLIGSSSIPCQVSDVGADGEKDSLGLGEAHQGFTLTSGEECLTCVLGCDLLESIPLLLSSCHRPAQI